MVEAERLEVILSASGGSAASREIRGVGTSAATASKGVGRLDGALSTLSRAFSTTAGATGVLTNRLGEVDSDLDRAGNSAVTSSAKMQLFAGSTSAAAAASSALSVAMMGSVVPAAIALTSTLGPLVGIMGALGAGAAGLAGGFAAVIGTGMLAYGNQLAKQNKRRLKQVNSEISRLNTLRTTTGSLTTAQAKRLTQLKSERTELKKKTSAMGALGARMSQVAGQIKQIILPLGNQFIPLIRDGINALPQLTRNIVNALGSLKPFRNELRRLGQSAMTVIPQVVGWFMDMGRRAIPVFRRLTQWAGTRIPQAVSMMGGVVGQTWGTWKRFAQAIIGTLGPLTRFGVTVTNILVPALTQLVNGFTSVIQWVNSLSPAMRRLIAVSSLVAPAVLGIASVAVKLGGALATLATRFSFVARGIARILPLFARMSGVINPLLPLITTFGSLYVSNFANIRRETNRVLGVLGTELMKTFQTLRTVAGPAVRALRTSFGRFAAGVESALRPVVRLIGTTLANAIRQAGSFVRGAIRQFAAFRVELGSLRKRLGVTDKRLRALSRSVQSMVPSFSKARRTAASFIGRLRSLEIGFRDVMSVVGLLAPTIIGLIAPMGSVATTGGRLGRSMLSLARYGSSLGGVLTSLSTYYAALRKAALSVLIGFGKFNQVTRIAQRYARSFGKSLGTLVTRVRGVSLSMGSFRSALARVAGFIPRLIGLIGRIVPALLGLSAPITAVVLAVGGLYLAWQKNFLGIRSTTMRVLSAVTSALRGDTGQMRRLVTSAVTAMRRIWRTNIIPMMNQARVVFGQIQTAVMSAMNFIWHNAVQPAVRGIMRLWRIHAQALLREVRQTYPVIQQLIGGALNTIKALVTTTLQVISSLWRSHGNTIRQIARFTFDTIGSVIGTALDVILTTVRVTLNAIQGDWGQALNAVEGLTRRIFSGIGGWLKNWGGGLVRWIDANFLGSILRKTENFGRNALSTFKDWFGRIRSFLQGGARAGIVGAVNSIGDGITKALRSGAQRAKRAFNAAWPNSIPIPRVTIGGASIPSVTIAGQTVGGGRIPSVSIGGGNWNLPQLDTGGFVEDSGLAMIHAGEEVVPKAEVSDRNSGSGGSGVYIENIDARGAQDPDAVASRISDEFRSLGF